MREIKFRGKRIDNGEWVYGSYQADVMKLNRHTIIFSDGEGFYCEEQVDPKTVGQYTENHDKNGKEVFEGHRIKFTLPQTLYWAVEENQAPIGVIEYEPDKGGFIVMFREHGLRQPYVRFDCNIACGCEILEG